MGELNQFDTRRGVVSLWFARCKNRDLFGVAVFWLVVDAIQSSLVALC